MSSRISLATFRFGLIWSGLACCTMSSVWAKEAAQPDAKKPVDKAAAVEKDVTQGALRIVGDDGTVVECPLEHTDVQADISGFISRVKVTQSFKNPTKEKIEAVYVFPLPHEAAVDDMTMVIGDRRIVGLIKRRDAARQIYEAALAQGQTAALLEQERPNIFTQSVGNIAPGQEVKIEISYVDVLKYDQGTYEFAFPMVVGPRFNPQKSPGQPEVADAAKINPPVLKPKERTSHDISLSVNLDAGVPIRNLSNVNHKVFQRQKTDTTARVRLLQEDSIPNKDFVLRYDVVGEKPEMAVLAHTGDYGDAKRMGDGYFMLMIQPKEDERLKKSPPREIVFLVDTSGSMSGQPTAQTRAAMEEMLKLCREQDTIQVVTFASQAYQLFEKPVPVTEENIKKAVSYSRSFRGGGGTHMLKGVQKAIDQPIDKERVRIVVMLSDGYIGNEAQIIEHVGKHCGDQIRFWTIGIGSSPNMFLIDGVAKQGGGMGKRLGLKDDAKPLCTEVITRIQRAQLAKIQINWGDLDVCETFPQRIPELWAGRPVVVFGRYRKGGDAKLTINGRVEGEDVSWPLAVSLPAEKKESDVLAKVWARKKIESLMQQSYYAGSPAVEEEVTALALRYRLMSQYTSFVAVDEKDIDSLEEPARPPRRMMVPVPLPDGTKYEGFFGGEMVDVDAEVEDLRVDAFAGTRLFRKDAEKKQSVDRLKRLSGKPLSARFAWSAMPARGRRNLALNNSLYSLSKSRGQIASGFAGGGIGGGAFGPHPGAPALTIAPTTATFGRASSPATRRLRRPSAATRPTSRGASFGLQLGGQVELAQSLRESQDGAVAVDYFYLAAAKEGGKALASSQAQLKAASELMDEKDLEAARQAATEAYFLDLAAVNAGQSGGQSAQQAASILQDIRAKQLEAWLEKQPKLKHKLKLVVRDQSLADALAAIASSADLEVEVLAGSIADAATWEMKDDLRADYLDLRGASVAQALDWLLRPCKLDWWIEDDKLRVGTLRRRDGKTAWIHDVSLIALPLKDEFAKIEDVKKKSEMAKQLTDAFLATVRGELEAGEQDVIWFSPVQLLILGDAKRQSAADKVLTALTDDSVKVEGKLAELAKVTRPRAASRKERAAKRMTADHLTRLAAMHNHYGWQLLAAASSGRVDDEALTLLNIAWNDAQRKALATKAPDVVLKSLWMVTASARALPDNAKLQDLASEARGQTEVLRKAALAGLQQNPDDKTQFARLLFAALGSGHDKVFRKAALKTLNAGKASSADLNAVRTILTAVLSDRDDINNAALAKLVESRAVTGDELTSLLALACYRAQGDAWNSFRRNSDELIGKQALRGEVVVFINNLPQELLELARR